MTATNMIVADAANNDNMTSFQLALATICEDVPKIVAKEPIYNSGPLIIFTAIFAVAAITIFHRFDVRFQNVVVAYFKCLFKRKGSCIDVSMPGQ